MKYLKLIPLDGPAEARLSLPGSKSYTNRALVLAAMTRQPVKIYGPLFSDDTQAMISCLQTLDIGIEAGEDFINVSGDITAVADRDYDLDAGLSGTTMRFMLALCAVLPGRQTLRGQKRLQERPVGSLVNALRQLGANIDYLGEEGYPPLLVSAPKLAAGNVTISGRESSQYLSALLMVAPLVGAMEIEVEGELISGPYVDMTVEAMRQFGVMVSGDSRVYHIAGGQQYSCSEYAVEGDVSSASYFFAIAALTGSTLTLDNISLDSLQADIGFLEILRSMGNVVTGGDNEITIEGKAVQAVNADMRACPDQAQTLAVLAAFAAGTTHITGVKSLRIKETERVRAVQQELDKMGIKTAATADTLTIHGGNPRPARIATYNDHRMAMAFTVAGAKLPGMVIQEPDVVNKTFPDFWQELESIGVGISLEEQP